MSISSIPHSPCALAIADLSQAAAVRTRRFVAAVVAVACAVVLAVASWLTPSAAGHGTHEALSLPRCTWIAVVDLPCPTCGMTTAFAHAADGNLGASFLAQPMGFLLALATAMALLVSLYVVATGSRVARAFSRLLGKSTGWAIAALIVAAWGFKIISYKGLL